ncbi:MAG: KamA family radical SAM protein [Treponema sp.]|jgi:lysine 2,3-aminomutase|nr:KamA family radical SAM protein [Treponema sp.]
MAELITSVDKLPPLLRDSVSPGERAFIEGLGAAGRLPFAVTPHFASLARPEADDPLRRQFIPDPREARSESGPFALDDPLGESRYRAAPRLVRQYPDRALLLAGGACAGYCRHCFRRARLSAAAAFIGGEELPPILAYLKSRPEVRELLISGGDPLTAPDAALEELFTRLRRARPDLALRVCSRVPVTNPERVGDALTGLFRRFAPLRVALHINHPRELSGESRRAFASLTGAGIQVLVQTVLLKGVNDHAETLAELFSDCVGLGLSPYYLFQLDLAPGIAHFRLPLRQGLALYRELRGLWAKIRNRPSGAELPVYAVDLPGGGGKIRLSENSITGEADREGGRVCLLKAPDGKLWEYPAE